jgi:PKD repeat protein
MITGITALILSGGNKYNDTVKGVEKEVVQEEVLWEEAEEGSVFIPEAKEELPEESNMIPAPVADFNPDITEGCAPLKVNFTNESKYANTYYWELENNKIVETKNTSIVFEEPGEFTVTLIVKNETGTEDRKTKRILVKERPTAAMEIDIAGSDISNREVLFNNQSEGANSYSWDFGDKEKAEGENVSHIYKDYGVYEVKLIAKNDRGCSDTARLKNRFVAKNYALSFPNSFKPTPSGSSNSGFYDQGGTNGIFYPVHNGVKKYQLKIFTPSGLEVFSTNNIKQGWNGYIRGRMAPAGIYIYKVKGVYPNGQLFDLQGNFRIEQGDYYMN